jgi:hypothetical protein
MKLLTSGDVASLMARAKPQSVAMMDVVDKAPDRNTLVSLFAVAMVRQYLIDSAHSSKPGATLSELMLAEQDIRDFIQDAAARIRETETKQ